jgi:hypothetical protein
MPFIGFILFSITAFALTNDVTTIDGIHASQTQASVLQRMNGI